MPQLDRRLPFIKKLSDNFGNFVMRVECKCGHLRDVQTAFLEKLAGRDCTLEKLTGLLRCSKCQAKNPEVYAIRKPVDREAKERYRRKRG
jgi:hypothetical protein